LVALFKDQRAVVNILAPDIKVENRKREARSVFYDLIGKACRNPFAPRLPIQICRGHANGPDVRVFS
jgi:hypothetical protein